MSTDGTVDAAEIARFAAMAADWWNPSGRFRPLHRLNPLRVAYIRDALCRVFDRDPLSPDPLNGLRIADVGCGGGLLAEPLTRLGARVVGIDAGPDAIRVARTHAAEEGLEIDYRQGTAETVAASGERFDAVTALEILEHVADVPLFLDACAALVKPGGALAFATLNRTAKSWAGAIVGAEWILGWLPRGTHDWKKFLRPSELSEALARAGFGVRDLSGVVYQPLADDFRLAPHDLSINYLGWAERRKTVNSPVL